MRDWWSLSASLPLPSRERVGVRDWWSLSASLPLPSRERVGVRVPQCLDDPLQDSIGVSEHFVVPEPEYSVT
jgi:hypothetical protein